MKEINKKLSQEQKHVLFDKGTEMPFTSELLHNKDGGVYKCANCGHVLFDSDSKFDSGTGWPSFDKPKGEIKTETDKSIFMERTEVMCPNCGAHLGHVFDDGPKTTGKRYCINGCTLNFEMSETRVSEHDKKPQVFDKVKK